MHAEALEWVTATLQRLRPRKVLELGSRNVNGGARGVVPTELWWGIDLEPGPGVDEVASAERYRPRFEPDVIVCTEMLEHTASAMEIVSTALRHLAPGGALVVTAACAPRARHSAVDGGPLRAGEYYWNIHPPELGVWFKIAASVDGVTLCSRWEITEHWPRGDVYAIAWRA